MTAQSKGAYIQQPESLVTSKHCSDNVTVIIPTEFQSMVNLKTFAEKKGISNRTAIRWAKCGYIRTQKIGRERLVFNKCL